MSLLRIGNKLISTPIIEIIKQLREETGFQYFSDIHPKQNDLLVTCPFHKDGHELHPSFSIHTNDKDDDYAVCHCFTCGFSGTLDKVVNQCFNQTGEFGNEWLVERFGDIFIQHDEYLPEIDLNPTPAQEFLDSSVLEGYRYYHPYMYQRKLTKEVIDKFSIGYDKDTDSITFPVWDENGNLVSITRRSVTGKRFQLEESKDKPVYLLNYIKKENYTTVYVCESQINALTLWGWGYPAVALLGTGSRQQYDILKKSGIRNYILCLDGDEAGYKGTQRFLKNMPDTVMISVKRIPQGKDVNDLSKEEFSNLPLD